MELIRPSDLDATATARWTELIEQEPRLSSPFYHPEFFRIVDGLRDGVRIAVIQENSEIIGFFPFQSGKDRIGYPVGGWLNDFQGPIGQLGKFSNVRELLRGCNLAAFKFHGLDAPAAFTNVQPFQTLDSPYIDLSNGFDEYQSTVKNAQQNRSQAATKNPENDSRIGAASI